MQQGTFPNATNQAGTVSGVFTNVIGSGYPVAHGFIRTVGGTFTTFDFPGAGVGEEGDGTFPMGVDEAGDVAGYWVKWNGPSGVSGFLRTADGPFTNIAVAGAGSTSIESISPLGEIAGSAASANNVEASVGLVRSPQGTMTLFAYAGADETEPLGITRKERSWGSTILRVASCWSLSGFRRLQRPL